LGVKEKINELAGKEYNQSGTELSGTNMVCYTQDETSSGKMFVRL
jgi:hypothetical protein